MQIMLAPVLNLILLNILCIILLTNPFCYCQVAEQIDSDDLSSTAEDYPYAAIANASWTNSASQLSHTVNTSDGTQVRAFLLRNPSGMGPRFASGFICNGTCDTFLFSVFALFVNSGSGITYGARPQIVWTANRARPVHENATLRLTSDGDLRLTDVDGTLVWSTNTSGKGVASIQLHKSGNLVLTDDSNKTVWQSWDHPTDTLLPSQIITVNQSLISSLSTTNSSEGPYYLAIGNSGLGLYASAPGNPQNYWDFVNVNGTYATYNSSSSALDLYNSSNDVAGSSNLLSDLSLVANISAQFIRIDSDGVARLYGASDSGSSWDVLFSTPSSTNPCLIPSYCGLYGLCTGGQCSCSYGNSNSTSNSDPFTPVDPQKPNLGCTATTPLTCDAASDHYFVQLSNVDYSAYAIGSNVYSTSTLDECKQKCLQDCECKAAFFINALGSNATSTGSCYMSTEVYTMRQSTDQELQNNIHYQPTALIKVQNTSLAAASPTSSPTQQQNSRNSVVIGIVIAVGIIVLLSILVVLYCCCFHRRREEDDDMEADDDPFLKAVPGLPSRFTLVELKEATQNFNKKLGEGGFGSVFLGELPDGTRIAVKRLEGSGQGQKEFRNEVCTIGSIHHLNLVRLCGFCAEKGHRLLVYEFMPNGSLDAWLFVKSINMDSKDNNTDVKPTSDDERVNTMFLNWSTRFNIAVGTAQGLAYLHEQCRERIIHFDVKPQNILLDENFEAKVSDFGLSKFVKRDQSQVMTTMRGTPGYLAPEWLHSTVTEKADVFSYGIVLLEIVSGRRCLETSNVDSGSGYNYLPTVANLMVQQGKVMELVDFRLGGEFVPEEVKRAVYVGLWCTLGDPSQRPSMGSVVQMLEGIIPVETPPEISNPAGIWAPHNPHNIVLNLNSTSSVEPWSMLPEDSVLTGPR